MAKATPATDPDSKASDRELWTALLEANDAPGILRAIAVLAWCKAGRKGDPDVPTEPDLVTWLATCPARARAEADLQLSVLYGAGARWQAIRDEPTLRAIQRRPADQAGARAEADDCSCVSGPDLPAVHTRWRHAWDQPPHPAAPLIVAWQNRPRPVERDSKQHPTAGILPRPLAGGAVRVTVGERRGPVDDADRLPGVLGSGTLDDRERLPSFAPGAAARPIVRMPTLELLHGAGVEAHRPGRGAPWDLRMFYEALIDVPREARDGGVARLTYTLSDLWRMLAAPTPAGPGLLKLTGERWDRFAAALRRMRDYTVPADDGLSAWLPIAIRSYPVRDGGVLRLDLSLPPGSDRGPRILRGWLRRYGADSYSAWRAWLAFAYLWDRSAVGGHWVRATRPMAARDSAGRLVNATGAVIVDKRGEPVTKWTDRRAVLLGPDGRPVRAAAEADREPNPDADRLHPWLSLPDLAALGYPPPDGPIARQSAWKRGKNVLAVLRGFAADGTVDLVERDGRYQIRPPGKDPDPLTVPRRAKPKHPKRPKQGELFRGYRADNRLTFSGQPADATPDWTKESGTFFAVPRSL